MRLWGLLGVAAVGLIAGSAAAAEPLIVYVSPNPIGVNDFLKLGKAGTERVAKALGGEAKIFESSDPTTQRQNLEAAAKAGAKVVVAIGFEFNDMLPEVAAAIPHVKFLQVDSCPFDKMKPNIYCSVFREYEASFLTGAEAALTSKTGKVGAIGALDIPFLHRYTDGFIAGAKHVKPDVKVSPTLWVGGNNPFSDPARGQQRAAAMVADNADRVLAAGAGSNGGIFKAMEDLAGAAAFGVDVNQCPQAPGVIMDNVEKKTDVAVELAVKGIVAGSAAADRRARPEGRRHGADRARRRRQGFEVPDRRLSGRHRQGEGAAGPDRQRRDQDRRPDDGEVGRLTCPRSSWRPSACQALRRGVANDHVDLAVARGEIHAVMGENGAGKSTLMSILYGLQRPDAGEIRLRGREVRFRSPLDAIAHGIGMVHQAFKLFDSLTVWENIVYGGSRSAGVFIDRRAARRRVSELAHAPSASQSTLTRSSPSLSVGVRQRVEILKALYRDARILILDEPTAVLTPQERDGLFRVMKPRRRGANDPLRHPQDPRSDGDHRPGHGAARRPRRRDAWRRATPARPRSCAP